MFMSLRCVKQLHCLFYNVIATNVHHHFQNLVALFEGVFQYFFSALGDLGSLDALLQKNLQRSSPVLVHRYLIEVILYRVKDFFDLGFAGLLEKHLTEEVC